MSRRHAKPIEHAGVEQFVNATLDHALRLRVALHRERQAGRLEAADYLAGLEAVRAVEDALEPLRASKHTRAFETAFPEADEL